MPYHDLHTFSPVNEHFKITITRKSQLMEGHEPMQIVINGYRAGVLKNGETATYHVRGSNAELQAYLAMNKTPLLHINNNGRSDHAFLIESHMTDTLFIIGFILVIIATALVLYTEQLIYMLIAAPPALYHLYLRFIRKDQYLLIKEI